MTRPAATIVIPTHNRPDLAHRALKSTLHQTVGDLEVIVVDDGSAEPFSADPDPRVKVIRHDRPRGSCAARNAGLEAARTEWITFLDDDDELLPHMVESSLRAARVSELPRPVAVLSGRADVDPSGRTVMKRLPVTLPRGRHYFLEGSSQGSFTTQNTLFAPVDVLKEIGGFDEAIPGGWEHDDLFLRLNAVCSIQGVPTVAYLWHQHDGPRRHRAMRDCAIGMERTLEKHRDVFALYPRDTAHYLGTIGVLYLNAGEWGPAVTATTRAVTRDPRQARLWLWWLMSVTGPGGLAMYRAARRSLRGSRNGDGVR